mmetsp:Transcript_20357/g.46729  ORF Transcript_20357/g.46729 Transcript_20357/m.46729 type:complete len:233 (-) Transcript_20357:1447-2145(-)
MSLGQSSAGGRAETTRAWKSRPYSRTKAAQTVLLRSKLPNNSDSKLRNVECVCASVVPTCIHTVHSTTSHTHCLSSSMYVRGLLLSRMSCVYLDLPLMFRYAAKPSVPARKRLSPGASTNGAAFMLIFWIMSSSTRAHIWKRGWFNKCRPQSSCRNAVRKGKEIKSMTSMSVNCNTFLPADIRSATSRCSRTLRWCETQFCLKNRLKVCNCLSLYCSAILMLVIFEDSMEMV